MRFDVVKDFFFQAIGVAGFSDNADGLVVTNDEGIWVMRCFSTLSDACYLPVLASSERKLFERKSGELAELAES